MNLLRKYRGRTYSDWLLSVIKENENGHDFKKFEKIMQKCLNPAIENGDIISGSELKANMEEEINKFLVSDMFDEAKRTLNELSNANDSHILSDRHYFYVDEEDFRHALTVDEIAMLYDFDV